MQYPLGASPHNNSPLPLSHEPHQAIGGDPTRAANSGFIAFLLARYLLRRFAGGVPGGTRTPDLLLRRQLLYPAELLAHKMERVMGIEPT